MSNDVTGTPTAPGARWTGRTDFSLIDGRGRYAGSVTVAIGSTTLTLRYENRVLAEIDRKTFHEWLAQPRAVLTVHDVTWFTQTGLTCISISNLSSFVVPGSCVGRLSAVV